MLMTWRVICGTNQTGLHRYGHLAEQADTNMDT